MKTDAVQWVFNKHMIFNGFIKEKKIWDYRKQLKYRLLKLVESVGIL